MWMIFTEFTRPYFSFTAEAETMCQHTAEVVCHSWWENCDAFYGTIFWVKGAYIAQSPACVIEENAPPTCVDNEWTGQLAFDVKLAEEGAFFKLMKKFDGL